MIIGLTGPIGSGKSQVAAIWRECGLHVIDCDVVYRELLITSGALQRDILTEFPNAETSGQVDRATLGEIVFNDAAALERLETVTHPFVTNEVFEIIAGIDGDIVIEAIALLKSELMKLCDSIVCVIAPPELRILRVMARDNLTVEQMQARLNAQPNDAYYQEKSDYYINNDGTETELRQRAIEILEHCRV